MKKFIFSSMLLFTATLYSFAQTATTAAPASTAEISFEKEEHDFGTVKEGTMATYEFKFKNTGKEPLIISNVSASCGCTTPSWSREPIKPGATGTVTAVYNSNGRPGAFNKGITVSSNAKTAIKVLTIKGTVEQKPAESPVVVPQ